MLLTKRFVTTWAEAGNDKQDAQAKKAQAKLAPSKLGCELLNSFTRTFGGYASLLDFRNSTFRYKQYEEGDIREYDQASGTLILRRPGCDLTYLLQLPCNSHPLQRRVLFS